MREMIRYFDVILALAIAIILALLANTYLDGRINGGTAVRGMLWIECINTEEKQYGD